MQSFEDPSETKNDGFLIDSITYNNSQNVCFKMQSRVTFDNVKKEVFDELPKTPICLGIFRKYAEIDIQELERIQNKISTGRLDNIDMQSLLSIYKGHSAFSIFAKEVKFHEQVLIQMQETEFEEEEQADESLLENNVLRRIYRVLNLQTPDMTGENKDRTNTQPDK